MPDYSEIKESLNKIERLEKELNLKQLQINRLLNITQAINNNVSAEGLFNMYKSFLGWEVGIRKMVLFIKQKGCWTCVTNIGVSESFDEEEIALKLPKYTRLNNLDGEEDPFLLEFDVIIPVRHKESPIAYVLIGGFEGEEDMYSKVQFITTITNVIAVAIENKRLFKRQLEQERLKRELELASEMQLMLIPDKLPSNANYEMDSIYKPRMGVGGDYFDFVEFEDQKIVFCIGDVSGKGVAAALVMANFQAIFHTLIAKRTDLEQFIIDLNKAVHVITKGERFITLFVAEYDIQTRTLKYVNAGHNPPILIVDGQTEYLKKGSTILGPFDELPPFEVGEIQIPSKEATILAYTDGLTDLQNNLGDHFEEHLLEAFIESNYHQNVRSINSQLLETIDSFKGDEEYPDDITILTFKIHD